MANIFSIDSSLIKAVDDETARELIARLCRAELRAQGLPEAAVTWGGDQRAKDGGVDVRVDCNAALANPNFVKSPSTAIQVKAEKFPASKIEKEIVPKGVIRPAIEDLGKTDGAYIIVSTRDDCSDIELNNRRQAIKKCFDDHSIGSNVEYDFYDSRRIADWVEQHPSISMWLRQKIDQPLDGWRPYGPWAYGEEDAGAEYLIDDRVRVYVPGGEEGIEIVQAIGQIRKELQNSVSIRIVGLSGVGKTRLVQALFDDRIDAGVASPSPDDVIYVDLADGATPQPKELLHQLLQQGLALIVVVDNCGPETHRQLTEIVSKTKCLLKLITVEYDIRDDLPEETHCYRLEGSSPEIIQQLLKARYKRLSNTDAERIADFSDGNARVAFALASTSEMGGELSRLQDRELFERLFLQKNDPDQELLRCAEAASLVYSFDSEDISGEGEIAILAGFAEVTPLTFVRHIGEMKRRGLLQERGKWKAVLPHAIANGLASSALESLPGDLLYSTLIEDASDRLARSFTRRLGFLHDSSEATAIASRMLATSEKLGSVEQLSELESQMFSNLAPIAPAEALCAIMRATGTDAFLSVESRVRGAFARLAQSIAYDPEHFDDAARVLKAFALTEPAGHKHDSVHGRLKALFYCHLSGTQASPKQRHSFVEQLLLSTESQEKELGFELMEAGLEAWHFSSSYSFEFGARRRDYGWHPRSEKDVREWFLPWIELAANVGGQNNSEGSKARDMLAEKFRGLWGRVSLDNELTDIASSFQALGGWPEGWLAVRRILHFDEQKLSADSLAQLRQLESDLKPTDLLSEIRARVLARGSFSFDLDDEEFDNDSDDSTSASSKYEKAGIKAEALGGLAACTPGLIEQLIPDLCGESPGSNVYAFGRGIGANHSDVQAILDAVKGHIAGSGNSGVTLIAIRGILSGWATVDEKALQEFLDQALHDEIWQKWFAELQIQVTLDDRAYARLIYALENEVTPTWQFKYLAMGRATDPLTVTQIIELTKRLAKRNDGGLSAAIDLLGMVIHCTDRKDGAYVRELNQEILQFLYEVDWEKLNEHDSDIEYDLEVVLKFVLKSAENEDQVLPILQGILPAADESRWYRFSSPRKVALKPFFTFFPELALKVVCTEDVEGGLERAHWLVSNSYSRRGETALADVPAEILITWCDESSDSRYPFGAGSCLLFEQGEDEENPLALSDTAMRLFSAAPDKASVLNVFVDRLRPSGWSGSLADILDRRLPLLDQLLTNANQETRQIVNDAKARFGKLISQEREREESEERSRNASFE